MKTPFTAEQFFEVFKNYNETVYPMQLILFLLAVIILYYAIKPVDVSGKIIGLGLGFLWLWMGIVYHIMFFSAINKAAFVFGLLFVLQGILFLITGLVQNKLSFAFRKDGFGITGLLLIAYALIVYPVAGYYFGHIYPYAPTFGLPCPTTIFTFGMLLFVTGKCPVQLIIIPFLWSIIGFTAAFKFEIYQDAGLLVAGIVTLILLLINNRKFKV